MLDVFLGRVEFLGDSAEVFRANHDGRLIGHLAAVSVPTIFYIVRRNAGYERAGLVVRECLDSFTIVPAGRSTIELACTLPSRDLEDNIQPASALEAGLDAIVTRDPAGYLPAQLRVLTPAEIRVELARYAAGGTGVSPVLVGLRPGRNATAAGA